MKREQISNEFKWDMTAIYPSQEAWEADYAKAADSVELIKSFQGTLGESAERLCEMQECYDEINLIVEKLHVYANQHMHENTADAFYQGLVGRVQVLAVQLMEASSYIEPEILAIPEDKFKEMLMPDVLAKSRAIFL